MRLRKASRREFLTTSVLSGGLAVLNPAGFTVYKAKDSEEPATPALLEVNTRSLVARSDLVYLSPVQEARWRKPTRQPWTE